MSDYNDEAAELQAAINDYNRAVARYNAAVEEYNYTVEGTAQAISHAAVVADYVTPKLDYSAEHVAEMAAISDAVQREVEDLSSQYFTIKNISTASKKLTQLNNEYQRNFGLYNTLRRVTLGYVVGMDNNIISSESLRVMVEKNYLQNADYWISHCLMATMLWLSDEKEAAERAVEKAMKIDDRKSSLFFLLINLRFGRNETAAKWFEYYIKDIDVTNIGDEVRILLQVYLYNVCGEDENFKNQIRDEFNELLQSVRQSTANYDNAIKRRVVEVISAHVHKTFEQFIELQSTCSDYRQMISALENAEKNAEFAKLFTELYEEDSSAPKNLLDRIENVLYDLVNTYDEAEMVIVRNMDYNEMILKARGDVAAAQKMYNVKYRPTRKQTLGELMIKLALPSPTDEVDVRVRKFAVSFLCKSIIEAFADFKKQYNTLAKDKHEVTVDSFKVIVDEKNPNEAKAELKNEYKKNKNKLINNSKGVKPLTVFTVLFWIVWLASVIYVTILTVTTGGWNPGGIIWFSVSFLAAVGFTVWLIFHRRKAGAFIVKRMDKAFEQLDAIIRAIAEWRAKFTAADKDSELLVEALNKFIVEEEA